MHSSSQLIQTSLKGAVCENANVQIVGLGIKQTLLSENRSMSRTDTPDCAEFVLESTPQDRTQ